MMETFTRIDAERLRQNAQWGEQNHADGMWSLILGEEVGEVCEAALHGDVESLLAELTQVAAVAIQWMEAIGRRCTPY